MNKILCINPGSTSTRVALFEDQKSTVNIELRHENKDIEQFDTIFEQLDYRYELIEKELAEKEVDLSDLSIVIGRGGALRSVPGGVYNITDQMLKDCQEAVYARHPSNLGCHLAKRYGDKFNVPHYILDPPLIDEFSEMARVSGMKGIKRKSAFHALNERAVAKFTAEKLNKFYEDCNFVSVHLGSGISVTAHLKGKCVDNNYGLGGDGPFSPERCGSLPAIELAKLVLSTDFNEKEWGKILGKKSGFVSHLGKNNVIEILEEIENGNTHTEEVYQAMIYDIAKEIGAYSTILFGEVDGIILTGALAKSSKIVDDITDYVSFIAKVNAYPGEYEMEAMALGGMNILSGAMVAKDY